MLQRSVRSITIKSAEVVMFVNRFLMIYSDVQLSVTSLARSFEVTAALRCTGEKVGGGGLHGDTLFYVTTGTKHGYIRAMS